MNAAIRRVTDTETTITDAALAIALTALVWLQVSLPVRFFFGRQPGPRFGPGGPPENLLFLRHVEATPLTFILIAACFLPLALRRRYPVGVLAATTVAYSVYELTRNPNALVIIAVLVALYTLGTLASRKTLATWGGVFGVIVLVVSVPRFTEVIFFAEVVRNLAMMLAAAVLGDATRNRRAYLDQLEQRAAEAERTREEEARRRVDEERLRIARELHDITAHSLSIVAVQSAAAAHVIETDPAAAKRAVVAIRDTSRSALTELRAMLGVLRGAGEPAAPLTPTPGLARLGELVPPLTEAGLTVEVEVAPEVAELPPFVDASAYRIVQEALTNVLRHAGPAHVTVSVGLGGDRLVLDVADDGAASTSAEAAEEGHGIAGMRERASALGGTFQAGPVPGRGWRVHAELPLQGRP